MSDVVGYINTSSTRGSNFLNKLKNFMDFFNRQRNRSRSRMIKICNQRKLLGQWGTPLPFPHLKVLLTLEIQHQWTNTSEPNISIIMLLAISFSFLILMKPNRLVICRPIKKFLHKVCFSPKDLS